MNQTEKLRYRYEWSDINWKTVEMTVFKLQKRIYRASQCGNIPLVRRLQRLLLASRNSKLLAVRRVTQDNTGRKTAGVDGKIALKDHQRMELANTLDLNVKAMPIRRVWIDKPGKKEKRPLGIPTITDRINQASVKLALEPEWEARFEPNSYGFRPGRSTHDAIEAVFTALHLKKAYVLDADISGCFNNIDHKALLTKINTSPKLRRIIKGWIEAGIMDHGLVTPNSAGSQQGGILSPLLANIALHGMEYDIKENLVKDLIEFGKTKVKCAGRKLSQKRISIIRYADDFVIIHEDKNIVTKAWIYVKDWLGKMGLVLSEAKTKLCHTYESLQDSSPGFSFLGFDVRQYKSPSSRQGFKTIIKPHRNAIKTHQQKLKTVIRKLVGQSQETLIRNLNPIIRGWAIYNRYSVARKVFEVADDKLFWTLWAWGCRRHSQKGKKWIKRKYFRKHNGNNWSFKPEEGEALALHSDYKITRFVKVKGVKSPFDGDFVYWTSRMGRYPVGSMRTATLLKEQRGRCRECRLSFRNEDDLVVHQLNNNPKDFQYKNLILLHKHCSKSSHSRYECKSPDSEEPDEVKVSRPVLKPSTGGDTRT